MPAVRSQSLPGEREVYVEARFGGLEVTLGDEHGDILSADITGIYCVHVHVLGQCFSELIECHGCAFCTDVYNYCGI